MAASPGITRLRYAKSKDPDMFQPFLETLGYRVQIYQMLEQKGVWYLWFVPDDDRSTVVDNIDLDG